ncbi:MAG TPA: cation:proton antiporter [Candidatus Binatia bacterium]|nr:cation:proton antiporter [Candidatus Binatia bacterium]
MHNAAFLQDLAVVMIVAGLVTVTFHFLKLPVVLGYILAGVLIGPHALPFPLVTDQQTIHTLSELGLVFLLFALGLEFNFRKIRQIGATAFIVAPLETGLMFFAGYQIGQLFGWSKTDSVYLGGILMISSTTIITKTLVELNKGKEKFAEVIYGILIAEDVIAILLIASLSGVAMTGEFEFSAVLATLARLSIFLVMTVVLGLLVVPKLLGFVARFKSEETLLITVLGLCFGLALLAVKLRFSVALGSFIMGALIAESHDIRRIERLTAPLRDLFSAVFFVAIGLLIDPKILRDYALPVAVICLTLVGGKILACSFGSFVAGYDRETSLRVGLGLAQIGEFSFIIAALGVSLGVTSHFLYPIAVSVSAITSVLTPFLIQHADQLVALHDRLAPRSLWQYQRDYTAWIARLREARVTTAPRRMVRRMLLQLAVNVALIAGLFLGAVLLDRFPLHWLEQLPPWTGGRRTVLWFAGLLCSLPIFLATLHKLQALSMLLAELTVHDRPNLRNKLAMRALVANTTLFTGIIALALLLLLLSSVLLPSWEVFLVLLGLAVMVAVLLRTFFIRIYSQAQVSIRDTLAREPLHSLPEGDRLIPSLLESAELVTAQLAADSPALGKQIRELQLRTRTGATAVAIRRGSETVISPEPDFEFQIGDQVLLIGNARQLHEARKVFTANIR